MYKIHVRDFQSLEKIDIEINGFTAILGQNNTGKSALVRAIYAAFTNGSGSETFIRHGAKECLVSLVYPSGEEIVWEKGSGKNNYSLNGKKWEKVGREVPEEILSLGIAPVVVTDKKIWPQFALQVEGQIFLLDKSSSFIAEAISDTKKVSQYLFAIKNADSDLKRKKIERELKSEDKAEVEKSLEKFQGFEEIKKSLQGIIEKESLLEKKQQEFDKKKSLRDTYQTNITQQIHIKESLFSNIDVDSLRKILQRKKSLHQILEERRKIEKEKTHLQEFSLSEIDKEKTARYIKLKKTKESHENIRRDLFLVEEIPFFDFNLAIDLELKQERLRSLVLSLAQSVKNKTYRKAAIARLMQQHEQIESFTQELGGTDCPLCKQKIQIT